MSLLGGEECGWFVFVGAVAGVGAVVAYPAGGAGGHVVGVMVMVAPGPLWSA